MSFLILASLLIDLIVGDPRTIPHPVVLIGKFIARCEQVVRKITNGPFGLRVSGILLVVLVCSSAYLATWAMLWLATWLNVYLGIALHLWLLSTTLAVKSLRLHAQAVAMPLSRGDLATARQRLALIVGRDTERLDQREITRATVETVSENTVDGIVSPLFYAFIGGAPLAMTYKAINTLDSMIGHRDRRYIFLGWAAAKLDDLANYIPARLAGLFYLILSPLTPGGFRGVLQGILQDASGHPSPNSGIPEAAVAGALGVQLGGTNYYRGEVSYRPQMGRELFTLSHHHIQQALAIMYGVTFLAMICGVLIRYLFEVGNSSFQGFFS